MGGRFWSSLTWKCRDGRRGASLIEFTLVGIPIMFLLISVFEISRGMWMYLTAAHAARESARFIVVHGSNCKAPGEPCGRAISQIAQQLQSHLVGMDPNEVQVTFRAGCPPLKPFRDPSACSGTRQPLQAYLSDASAVPWPGGAGAANLTFAEVEIEFPFRSAIAMFWPGAGGGMTFGVVNMFAGSREMFQY